MRRLLSCGHCDFHSPPAAFLPRLLPLHISTLIPLPITLARGTAYSHRILYRRRHLIFIQDSVGGFHHLRIQTVATHTVYNTPSVSTDVKLASLYPHERTLHCTVSVSQHYFDSLPGVVCRLPVISTASPDLNTSRAIFSEQLTESWLVSTRLSCTSRLLLQPIREVGTRSDMPGLSLHREAQTPNMNITTPDRKRRALQRHPSLRGTEYLTPESLPLEQTDSVRTLDLGPPAVRIPEIGFEDSAGKRLFRPQRTFRIPSPAHSFGDVSPQPENRDYAGHLLAKPLVPGRKSKVGYLRITPASKLDYRGVFPRRTPSPLLTTSPWMFNVHSPILPAQPWTTREVPGVTIGEIFWQLQDSEWYDVLRQAPFPLPWRSYAWKNPFCKPVRRSPSRRAPRRSLRLKDLAKRKTQGQTCSGAWWLK